MPSSGGNQQYDEAARSGVGDGDALAAGTENIRSFAPIENAPFLNSHEQTLYDVFDEMYDEPVRPPNSDRAIALPPQLAARQREHDVASSLTVGKEFSTLRKLGKPPDTKIADRDSDALLYVDGRVPLHLKLEVFDRYDGIDWFPAELDEFKPGLSLETLNGRPWLSVSRPAELDLYGVPEVHALKIVHLDTNRIPVPTQFLRLHLDRLDRPDLFRWAQPGILKIERRRLPPLTVLHVQSRAADERLLNESLRMVQHGPSACRQFGDDAGSRRVRDLAARWTAGHSVGWEQVKAIVSRLRSEYRHDRAARPPADCRNTVADFLFRSRGGPDYQFASSAVWLLRSQGYGARLVSGFYGRPSRYDARSQHTPVLAEDVHFWAEVSVGLNHWVPIEPTPEYELLSPPLTFAERVRKALSATCAFAGRNKTAILLTLAGCAWLLARRRRVADCWSTLFWSFRPVSSHRERLRMTAALLESRFRRAGLRRPPGVPVSRWLRGVASLGDATERDALVAFGALADWAGFAPAEADAPGSDPPRVCRNAESIWSWKTIVRVGAPETNGSRNASLARRLLHNLQLPNLRWKDDETR
jgi:protein-glutamine gamma-glutamyltransferase